MWVGLLMSVQPSLPPPAVNLTNPLALTATTGSLDTSNER